MSYWAKQCYTTFHDVILYCTMLFYVKLCYTLIYLNVILCSTMLYRVSQIKGEDKIFVNFWASYDTKIECLSIFKSHVRAHYEKDLNSIPRWFPGKDILQTSRWTKIQNETFMLVFEVSDLTMRLVMDSLRLLLPLLGVRRDFPKKVGHHQQRTIITNKGQSPPTKSG